MTKTLNVCGIALLAFLTTSSIGCSSGKNQEKKSVAKDTAATKTAADTPKQANNDANSWQYEESEDKMTSGKIYIASVQSPDTAYFDFPYNGGSLFNLYIRNKEGKNDVLFTVSKGQIASSFNGSSSVRIRFDQEQPISVPYNLNADVDATTIFLSSGKKIIEKLKTAKQVIIEVEFFQVGRKQITFNVAGLKWEH